MRRYSSHTPQQRAGGVWHSRGVGLPASATSPPPHGSSHKVSARCLQPAECGVGCRDCAARQISTSQPEPGIISFFQVLQYNDVNSKSQQTFQHSRSVGFVAIRLPLLPFSRHISLAFPCHVSPVTLSELILCLLSASSFYPPLLLLIRRPCQAATPSARRCTPSRRVDRQRSPENMAAD